MSENYDNFLYRQAKTYSFLRKANINDSVAVYIANVLALYPINTKGKWFYKYQKLWNKLDGNQKTGFVIKKLNAIANREKINNHFLIGESCLFKENERDAEKRARSRENLSERVGELISWVKWKKTNEKNYWSKNDEITSLCILLIDKFDKLKK